MIPTTAPLACIALRGAAALHANTSMTLRGGIAPAGPGVVVGTCIEDTPPGSSSNRARATFFVLDSMDYRL